MKPICLLLVIFCLGCGAEETASRPDNYPAAPKSDQMSIEGGPNTSVAPVQSPR